MQRQPRILLVDDDGEALEMLQEYLAEEGYAVETARNGVSALDKLLWFRADVVVTDFEMPGMNGLELIRIIEARYPGRATLLVTARERRPLMDALASADGPPVIWLSKPVDLDHLALALRRLIEDDEAAIDQGRVATP
jgi:two-component system response regulator MprA